MKYVLTEVEKKQYCEKHCHIAPDLIDGISTPSAGSDMYSYGRIKNVIKYSRIDSNLFDGHILSKCLKYQATDRPSAKTVTEILQCHQ